MPISKEFEKFYEEISLAFGMEPILAKIFATLYLEPKEISMEEVSKRTGYSLASISNKVKVLEMTDLIKRIKKPKTKKVFLYVEKDILNKIRSHMLRKEKHGIKKAKETIPAIIEKYDNQKKLSEKEREKLDILKNYYRQILAMEKIVRKMITLLEEFDQ